MEPNSGQNESLLFNGKGSGRRLIRRNSVNSIRSDFFSRLPEKIRAGFVIEAESSSLAKIDLSKSKGVSKDEKEYYERQLETLKSFDEVDALAITDSVIEEDEEDEEQRQAEVAMNISNFANVILLALKIYATVKSGSIAIAASTLDSLLDLMAGGILWLTHLSMKSINIYKYPIGKLRVQPVGIIVFAAIMATLGPFLCHFHLLTPVGNPETFSTNLLDFVFCGIPVIA